MLNEETTLFFSRFHKRSDCPIFLSLKFNVFSKFKIEQSDFQFSAGFFGFTLTATLS